MAANTKPILLFVIVTLISTFCNAQSNLYAGQSLNAGSSLRNGRYRLTMQTDCNLALYAPNAIWDSNTTGRGTNCSVTMQDDGNLVMYLPPARRVIWATNTSGARSTAYVLTLQSDRNIVIYGPGRSVLGASNSTDFPSTEVNSTDFSPTEVNSTDFPPTDFSPRDFPSNSADTGNGKGGNKSNIGVVIGSVVGGIVLVVGIGLILFVWRKKYNEKEEEDDSFLSADDDYEKGTGPKRFTYAELALATNKFAEEGKLGEGGFGGVYRGLLRDSNTDIAVKRVSTGSRQGKKEFVSEVKIISQLRHRNLVQLIGWCHEKGEFLLVYEFMPNGSLDFHLFGGRSMINWVLRYKIALGLASSLLYLHEEWEQCVVHRDIKSSNVMLDSSFNAKLGDFGLARFADHELGMKTTRLAGTMGYLAPECVVTGKAGKESDVYSFGVVALEIACGRRVVEPKEEEDKVGLVAWVWELYGSGRLMEAVDAKLGTDFDEQQMVRLMIVGLWCANPDHNQRPSIKQAISVLNFEAPLPELPLKMSAPNYFTSSMQNVGFSYASSSSYTDSQGTQSQVSNDSSNTNSSQVNASASASLLQLATRGDHLGERHSI